jgi:hypothetical protein
LTVCNALYFLKGSGIEHVPSAFLDLVISKGYHPALGHALFADPAVQQEASTNCCDILAMRKPHYVFMGRHAERTLLSPISTDDIRTPLAWFCDAFGLEVTRYTSEPLGTTYCFRDQNGIDRCAIVLVTHWQVVSPPCCQAAPPPGGRPLDWARNRQIARASASVQLAFARAWAARDARDFGPADLRHNALVGFDAVVALHAHAAMCSPNSGESAIDALVALVGEIKRAGGGVGSAMVGTSAFAHKIFCGWAFLEQGLEVVGDAAVHLFFTQRAGTAAGKARPYARELWCEPLAALCLLGRRSAELKILRAVTFQLRLGVVLVPNALVRRLSGVISTAVIETLDEVNAWPLDQDLPRARHEYICSMLGYPLAS